MQWSSPKLSLALAPTLAVLSLMTVALQACESGGGSVTPREGDWEGDNVVFTIEDGAVSGWGLLGMYCQGTEDDAAQTPCLSHPRGFYADSVSLDGGGFLVALDGLTLDATFVDEMTVTGTWRMDTGSCCSASGTFDSVHVRDLPADPVDDGGGGTDGGGGGGGTVTPPTAELMTSAAAMCAGWEAARSEWTEPTWTGSAQSCDPGELDTAGIDRVVGLVNVYRAMAGLPGVDHDAELDVLAQSCSLMMQAEQTISHYPEDDWACFTEDGARGASSSNLATAPALTAVDLYMVDGGNEDTLGHRRWILTNGLGPFGIGSTTGFSCLHVMGSVGVAPAPLWTAWPAPGYFPIQAYGDWSTIDVTGWSIHAYGTSLADADVTVTTAGVELEVEVRHLAGGYGGSEAISIVPDGWTMAVGARYEVSVSGVTPPISYGFDVVDCDAP